MAVKKTKKKTPAKKTTPRKKTVLEKQAPAKKDDVTEEEGLGPEYTMPPPGVPFRRIYERYYHPSRPDRPLMRIKFIRTDKE